MKQYINKIEYYMKYSLSQKKQPHEFKISAMEECSFLNSSIIFIVILH